MAIQKILHIEMTTAEDVDSNYITELYLAAIIDSRLYRNYAIRCINSLRRKKAKGIFDAARAPDIFVHGYLDTAQEYYKLNTGFKQQLNKNEKRLFAEMVFDYYREQIYKQ